MAGTRIRVDGSTKVMYDGRYVDPSFIQVGDTVEVYGVKEADGTVTARKILIACRG